MGGGPQVQTHSYDINTCWGHNAQCDDYANTLHDIQENCREIPPGPITSRQLFFLFFLLYLCEVMDVHEDYSRDHFTIYVIKPTCCPP